jgi:Cupin domain
VPSSHAHPGQEECFTVLDGQLTFRVGSQRVTAGPGDTVRIPPGIVHHVANAADRPARVAVTTRPALGMRDLQWDRRRCRVSCLNFSGHEASLPASGWRVVSPAAALPTFVVETAAAPLRRLWQARLVLGGERALHAPHLAVPDHVVLADVQDHANGHGHGHANQLQPLHLSPRVGRPG